MLFIFSLDMAQLLLILPSQFHVLVFICRPLFHLLHPLRLNVRPRPWITFGHLYTSNSMENFCNAELMKKGNMRWEKVLENEDGKLEMQVRIPQAVSDALLSAMQCLNTNFLQRVYTLSMRCFMIWTEAFLKSTGIFCFGHIYIYIIYIGWKWFRRFWSRRSAGKAVTVVVLVCGELIHLQDKCV